MSQKPITQKPIIPRNLLPAKISHPIKVHNIYTYIFIHALSGLGPSAHIYSVKNVIYLNLFFFNTSLLTLHTH